MNRSRRVISSARTALLATGAIAAPTLRAATYTWDPAANRSDSAGNGTWDTVSAVWDNGTADTP